VDGVLTKAEKDAFRVARKEMKENWKKYNQVRVSHPSALFRARPSRAHPLNENDPFLS